MKKPSKNTSVFGPYGLNNKTSTTSQEKHRHKILRREFRMAQRAARNATFYPKTKSQLNFFKK